MNKQAAAVIMAIMACSAVANAATVTPSPAIAQALKSASHQYCQMVATDKHGYQMMHRLKVLGHKTPIRTGIDWPWVMDFRETCEPTKADWRIYKQANNPFVKAVRTHYHAPVWTRAEAFNFCAKKAGVKGVTGLSSAKTFAQYSQVIYSCFPHKK